MRESLFTGFLFLLLAASNDVCGAENALPVQKVVTAQASFVVYIPKGWTCAEGAQPTFRTLVMTDPTGMLEAALFHGTSPVGNNVPALARLFLGGVGRQFPDLQIRNAMVSQDKSRITVDSSFTHPRKGKRDFRCWIAGKDGNFVYTSVETPAGAYEENRRLLLTVLSNVRVMNGAFNARGAAPVQVALAPYRMRDGSAAFMIPRDWRVQELGAGRFVANDATGTLSFIVASVDVISPRLRVNVPGAFVADYLRPHKALEFLASRQGVAANMRFVEVTPRQDIARQLSQVYTAGPVDVEDFVYTCVSRGGQRSKGYTMGISFGSRLGANWSFRHMTVAAPEGTFDAYLPNFVSMLQSYRINDQWAANYVAQGIARLRLLQQQTQQMVARNASEIRQMMQAAYDERQKSQDYIDYQRTNYIRGEQDWVSSMEGGTVYHTDTWGTKNTATGEYHEGQPFDYVNFEGGNAKHNEQMTPIDSRALWEKHVR